jgi:protein-tyrosine phosphatase
VRGKLWIGPAPASPDVLRSIVQQLMIDHVIDLNQNRMEEEWCKFAGVNYEKLDEKVADNFSPISPLVLERLGSLIKKRVDDGHRIYLHCTMARGRSPTVAAAYLMVAGESAENAMAIVRRARQKVWKDSDSAYVNELPELETRLSQQRKPP